MTVTRRDNLAFEDLQIDPTRQFDITNSALMAGEWIFFAGLQQAALEVRLHDLVRAEAYGEIDRLLVQYRALVGDREPNASLAALYASKIALLAGDIERATLDYLRAGKVIPLSRDKTRRSLREPDEISSETPIPIVIGVSNICDLNCVSCRAQEVATHPGNMRSEIFKRIVDDCCASGLTSFLLHQSNEPMLHPLIFEFLLYLEDKGASVTISTHLNSIDRFIRRARKQTRLPKRLSLRYSIDGATRETYNAIRINGDFDKLLHNIALIRDYCEEAGIALDTGSNFVVSRKNIGELATFYYTFGRFIPYKMMTFHFAGFTEARTQIIPYVKGEAVTHFFRPNHCGVPSSQIHFIHDGRQILCCHDPNDMSVIGSIEDPYWLENWWSGEQMKQIRAGMKAGDLSRTHRLCQGCYFPITGMLSSFIHSALGEMFWLADEFCVRITDKHIVDRIRLELRLNGYDLLAEDEAAQLYPDEETALRERRFAGVGRT
jgi:hypothetical protein